MIEQDEKYMTLEVAEVDGVHQVLMPEAIGYSDSPFDEPKVDGRPRPTLPDLPEEETDGYPWARWGGNDLLPTIVRNKIEEVPMAGSAIYRLVQMMYGNGLMYYRNRDLLDGPKIRRAYIPKVERWLRLNRIHTHYLPHQFTDFRFFFNTFSEMILSRDKKQIVGLFHKEAEFTRLSIQNRTTRRIESIQYSADFPLGLNPGPDDRRKILLFDWRDQEGFLRKLRGYKFAWHSAGPSPARMYYARPPWMGLFRDNGWMDASKRVPEVVNAMMKNQIILKYHIMIPESYFELRYGRIEFQAFSIEKKRQVYERLVKDINAKLSGSKNAYQSLSQMFTETEFENRPKGKIIIEAVDEKVKNDHWVPSSEKSDAQIVQALGMHPSQMGLQPQGGKMGAGSGSDQRESYNTGISLNTIEQTIILEVLNWVATFNAQTDPDWDITFMMDHTRHTTINNQEDGLEPDANTITVES
jgi:hypothetical protein